MNYELRLHQEIAALRRENASLRRRILELEAAPLVQPKLGRPRAPEEGVPDKVLRHRLNQRRYREKKKRIAEQ